MSTTKYTPRLAGKYKEEVIPALMKKFGYTSIMQTPKLQKICINRGVNGAVADKKLVDVAVDELSQISGQKAVATFSKKDISNFKFLVSSTSICIRCHIILSLDQIISCNLNCIRSLQ